MPNLKQHLKTSKEYLGYCDPFIHRWMDAMPKDHAQYRRLSHGYALLKLIEREIGKEAALEAFTHILADQTVISPSFFDDDSVKRKALTAQ